MDRVNEFLSHLKERLSSPFFFSFIISWIFCNWQIVVALLWYDPPGDYKGHLGLIGYIDQQANNYNSILYPFLFALSYTFLWPMINNVISWFQSWNATWGENLNLRAVKGGQVSISKYLVFRENYNKRTTELEKVIASESITLNDLESTRTALLEQQRQNNETKHQLSDARAIIDNYNRVAVISGKWKRIWKLNGETIIENIEIQNNILYFHTDSSMEQKYNIFNFTYDLNTKKVQFSLFHFNTEKGLYPFFSLNELTLGYNELKGTEYRAKSSVLIRYVKDVAVEV